MNIFDKLFRKRGKENAYYIKLRRSLLQNKFNKEIRSAYFLLGVPNTSANLASLKKAISDNSLTMLKKTIPYDVKRDNLELYLIKDNSNNYYFIILLDPIELYEGEQVLDIMPVNDRNFDLEPELIFDSNSK